MKVVCYARTSTLDQAKEEKVSIPDQINWAKELAKDRDWEFVEEYIEPGVTGDIEFEQREAASKLLQDAKPITDSDRRFDLVLVYHSSRLAREADLILRFHRVLAQDFKVQVYMRNAPIEPCEPDNYYWGGNYIQQITASLAGVQDQQENVTRGERVRSGFQGLAKRGVLVFAPYGYEKIRKVNKSGNYTWSWKLDPKKALIVQEIFENYGKKGMSLRAIQMSLNERKIPSPSGKVGWDAWQAATIKNILTNPTYIGKVRWGRKLGSKYKEGRTVNGKQKRILAKPDRWLLVDGSHPKIVDERLFNKVQERLKIRSKIGGRAIASDGLLTGLIRCGVCGKNCYHKTRRVKKGKKEYIRSDYICQSYIRYGKKSCRRHVMAAQKLHEIIFKEIDKLIKKAQKKKKLFYTGSEKKRGIWQKNLAILDGEIKRLEVEGKRLLMAYTAGRITLEEFGEEKDRIDNQVLEIQSRANELKEKLGDQEKVKQAEKRFLLMLKNFRKDFDKLDIKRQKDLISNLIETVTVGRNGKIDIKYRI